MKYDFQSIVDRRDKSSVKWQVINDDNFNRGIIPFSTADLDIKSAPNLLNGLQNYILDDGTLGYTLKNKEYLQSVCSWMKRRHNWHINEEDIVPAPGIISSIYTSINAYTVEGDGIIIFTPVYYQFNIAIHDTKRKLIECPLIFKNDTYTIDFELFNRLSMDKNNKMLLFCSPHNPIGRVWERSELNNIINICKKNNVMIISDEVHFDIIMPNKKHTVLLNADINYDKIVVCTSPSKSFNISGLQIANIIIKNDKIREKFIRQQRKSGIIMLNSLAYKACILAYNYCDEWLDEFIKLIYKNYIIISQYFNSIFPNAKVHKLEGTYLLWINWKYLKKNKYELERLMKEKAEVFFDEGYLFGKEGEGFERMNIACPTVKLIEALERIKQEIK